MIQQNELKAGNWISLDYAGDLLAAHKIIEVDEFGVIIEDGKTYTLIKVGNKWEYPEVPRKQSLSFRDIKGIPLTSKIFEDGGFKIYSDTTLDGKIIKDYSDKYSFKLRFNPSAPSPFTYEARNLDIAFVHQLQNIYQEVMNKELEITINPFNFQLQSQL